MFNNLILEVYLKPGAYIDLVYSNIPGPGPVGLRIFLKKWKCNVLWPSCFEVEAL
uniref:Uncharacterized protein n=1 Tax=Arundo donax TaxID=35708 RepID=A0A0A8ZM50_ARUDO